MKRRRIAMSGMTSERLDELRRIAEAATPGKRVIVIPESRRGHEWLILQVDGSVSSVIAAINKSARNMRTVDYCAADAEFFAAFDPPTVLAMLDEIERLRRERETLAAAVMAWDDYAKTIIENGPLAFDAIDAMERAEQRHREALALIEGGGGA